VEQTEQGIRMLALQFTLNGRPVETEIATHVQLIDVLRDEFRLKGAKRSCDMQVCGACTVLVDGSPVSSCTLLALEVSGKDVLTIEGLGSVDSPHPIAQAFIDNASLQCGFCTSGMILTAKALLDLNPHPSEAEIKDFMNGNLCRCTGYKKIVEAIVDAAG
jgi:carbon-monoxide dehydrogenase small subunit